MNRELARLDACAQAELVRSGEATPLELVDAAIARVEKLNPTLNAVITPLFEKARSQATSSLLAEGPFRGVPFLLKDLTCHSAGDPYHLGMRFLKERGWTETHDTHLAARFRAAGLVSLGKTNCPELGPMVTTEPVAYGPSCNPWNPDHSTGGSSGGSAAAVASGMVPVAHANDGGGSIRIPASECGLVGLKPSRGRTSLGPDLGDSWAGLVAEHVVSRSLRDSAALLDAVSGPMPGDPYVAPPPMRPFSEEVGRDPGALRVGVVASTGRRNIDVHPDCVEAVRGAAALLESLGHQVEESSPDALDDPETGQSMAKVIVAWIAQDLDYWSERTGVRIQQEDVEPLTWELACRGGEIAAVEYIQAVLKLQAFSRRMAAWWEGGFDLMISPTIPEPPPPLGSFPNTKDNPLEGFFNSARFVVFTAPFNITGQPAISLPLHWSEGGLPIGVQLVAGYGREDLLLQVASQLEQSRPWNDRRPPIHA
jgi:amidase